MDGWLSIFSSYRIGESLYSLLRYDIFFDEYVIELEKKTEGKEGVARRIVLHVD